MSRLYILPPSSWGKALASCRRLTADRGLEGFDPTGPDATVSPGWDAMRLPPATVSVAWEPGNGTRYAVTLSLMGPRVLLAWSNAPRHGRSMVLPHRLIDAAYMAEKLGHDNAVDLRSLLDLVEVAVGMEDEVPDASP